MLYLQGLQLVLRDMSNPLDMDPRRQLALQNKGNMLMLSSSGGFTQRALISSYRNLQRKQSDFSVGGTCSTDVTLPTEDTVGL